MCMNVCVDMCSCLCLLHIIIIIIMETYIAYPSGPKWFTMAMIKLNRKNHMYLTVCMFPCMHVHECMCVCVQ